MPSTWREAVRRAFVVSLAVGLGAAWAGTAPARDKSGALCEASGVVTGEGQLRERTKKCKKDDVVVVSLATASLPATRVAALICDLAGQVLIEPTTETPGVARVTCVYTGESRTKR